MFVYRDGFLGWYQNYHNRRQPSWLVMVLGFKRDAIAKQWQAIAKQWQEQQEQDEEDLVDMRGVSFRQQTLFNLISLFPLPSPVISDTVHPTRALRSRLNGEPAWGGVCS